MFKFPESINILCSLFQARTGLSLEICDAACQAGIDVLRSGGSAADAATKANIVLQDARKTNAGFGSNLTESGTVEMDAGLMNGSSLLFWQVQSCFPAKPVATFTLGTEVTLHCRWFIR